MIRWVRQLYSWGFPPRHDIVYTIDSKFTQRELGPNWITRFLSRHKDILRSQFSRQLDSDRARAADVGRLEDFFDLFHSTKLRSRVLDENIYNMDESGIMIRYAASSKVIVPRDRKKTRFVTQDGNRKNVSVVECISATGTYLRPMIIFNGIAILLAGIETLKNHFLAIG